MTSKCLTLATQLWNEWLRVSDDIKHPDDNNDFRFHLHAIQNLLYRAEYHKLLAYGSTRAAPSENPEKKRMPCYREALLTNEIKKDYPTIRFDCPQRKVYIPMITGMTPFEWDQKYPRVVANLNTLYLDLDWEIIWEEPREKEPVTNSPIQAAAAGEEGTCITYLQRLSPNIKMVPSEKKIRVPYMAQWAEEPLNGLLKTLKYYGWTLLEVDGHETLRELPI